MPSRRRLFLAAAAVLLLAPGASGELEACLAALGQLATAPYNASLPFLNGVTGAYMCMGGGWTHRSPSLITPPSHPTTHPPPSSSPIQPTTQPRTTGHVSLAYLYQKPMFAIMPNEAMGNYDLCRHAALYTPGTWVCYNITMLCGLWCRRVTSCTRPVGGWWVR